MNQPLKPVMPHGCAEFIVMVHNDPNVGHLALEVQRKAAALYRVARNQLERGHPTKQPCDHRPCKSWCHNDPRTELGEKRDE